MFSLLRALKVAGTPQRKTKSRATAVGSGLSLGLLAAALVFAGFASSACAQEEAAAILPDAPGPIETPDSSAQNPPSPTSGTCVISGTVFDTNSDVIQGARVVLRDRAGVEHQMESGPNGQFAFPALPAGAYRVTVTGSGMGTYESPWLTMHPGEMRIVSQVVLPVAAASTSITVNGNGSEINQELADRQVEIAEEQRVWGVFPNFYSSYDWNAPPLGPKQKFKLAFRSMMDPMAFAGASGIAGYEQYYNIFPGYGRGFSGYAKRYGAAYANDFSGRMLASGVFASLFHQDPRYFYKGTGSFPSRAIYAVSSAVITRDDDGRRRPNYSHVLGVFAAAALSNLYYPKASRGLTLTLVNGAVETAGNAGSNIAREFILKGITTHAGGKP